MDFHSLLRRDLQFLCKRNKIPANMTNLAMADALKSLEIVEGLDEYMNQKDSNVLQSPTSVAKLPPSTATRTTRRKTAMKAEPQSSSQLVTSLTSKSLDGEMDRENVTEESKTNDVKVETSVAKTPAARSTRKASAAVASCGSKVLESKKGEVVQSAYSTRRSTRLLEKCMADLSLITEQKVSAKEKSPDGEIQKPSISYDSCASGEGSEERSKEAEVIPGRDLSASMEKECEMLENDGDQVTGGFDMSVEKTETMEVISDEKESENTFVQVDKQEETLKTSEAVCEEGSNKNDNEQEIIDLEDCVDLDEIPVLEHANSETNNDNKESDIQAFESLGQVDQFEIEQAIQENDSEPEKVNTFDEEAVINQPDGDSEAEPKEDDSGVDSDGIISEADANQADHQETLQVLQENDSEIVKINMFDEDNMVDQTDSETEPEEDDSGVDSDSTISHSNQADHQETKQAIQENDSDTVKIYTFDEATMVDQTEPVEDDSGVDSDGTISEADSNEAVQGSDVAEEEMFLSESEGSVTAPTSPSLLLEEANVKAAPLSPFAAESISAQFPRPNKSAATTPSKNSAMKLIAVDNNNKENNMEMMVNVVSNGERKVEAEKKKKVEFDEENLKDVSMRQLVKLVKELSIKGSNNRTALQMLPGNNQTAE